MTPTLREHLAEGPYTLCMSAGFFGFYAHAGVLRVLLDTNLAPARVAGSSAGAMIAGAHAAGVSTDVMRKTLEDVRREHFWDPGLGLGLLRGAMYRELLKGLIGDVHIEVARVGVAISVWDIAAFRTHVVTSGPLVPAVHASSALPGLFQPVRVAGRLCTDGGVRDRDALASIQPGERVLSHHLVDGTELGKREMPGRVGVISMALERMPRPNPFDMALGVCAYDEAARRMKEILARPTANRIVH